MKAKAIDTSIQEGDSTPMIDMVFQLIAFFMVLVNFTEADQDARVVLPRSELAKPPESAQENVLTVNLGKDGKLYMAGQVYDISALNNRLQQEAEIVERQGKSRSAVIVVIRAHKDAKTGDVQHIIEEAQKPNVRFEKFTLRA
ncbi:MAG TPA: biopolymer transporter ExbD, partial [Pirellulales bacterium]